MSTLKADSDGRVALTGALTSRQVPAVFRDSQIWRSKGVPGVIDLAGVDRTDSSALALLLEWKSWAQAAGQTVRFINPPRSLCVFASLSQIGELLGWRTLDFDDNGEQDSCCG
ncbi:MAG: STAS domain-containing protein [Wenzhouxiangella sp.]|jgi:phospholipid transport system transporter-binding protein|nr:STAS domain-containing protein [Wenzhouxiangella sp.]